VTTTHREQATNKAMLGGPKSHRSSMLAAVLFLVLICVIAGITGLVVHGLLWLFVIAFLLLVLTLLDAGYRHRQVSGRSRN
jgi:uncharacterized membrane protein YdbT with pleckstrin-like domain